MLHVTVTNTNSNLLRSLTLNRRKPTNVTEVDAVRYIIGKLLNADFHDVHLLYILELTDELPPDLEPDDYPG